MAEVRRPVSPRGGKEFFDMARAADYAERAGFDPMDRPSSGALNLREEEQKEYVEVETDGGEVFYDQALPLTLGDSLFGSDAMKDEQAQKSITYSIFAMAALMLILLVGVAIVYFGVELPKLH